MILRKEGHRGRQEEMGGEDGFYPKDPLARARAMRLGRQCLMEKQKPDHGEGRGQKVPRAGGFPLWKGMVRVYLLNNWFDSLQARVMEGRGKRQTQREAEAGPQSLPSPHPGPVPKARSSLLPKPLRDPSEA